MKDRKVKFLIIANLIMAAVIAGLIFIKPEKPQNTINNNQSEIIEEKETQEPTNESSGKTITLNAYDFIIDTMSKAQYWDETQMPIYDSKEYQKRAQDYLRQTNGTGWKLIDEDTATFSRGFEGKLEINFSNYTAKGNTHNVLQNTERDPDGEPYRKDELELVDYNDETYLRYSSAFIGAPQEELDLFGATADGYQHVNPGTYDEYTVEYYKNTSNFYWIIYDTFNYYESIFEKIGCPLLNQPQGTLTSYKNKMVEVPEELINVSYTDQGDGLIHAVWKQDGFEWDWGKNKDNVWLDNVMDIYNQKFPETNDFEQETIKHTHLDGSVTYDSKDTFGSIYVCRCDPERSNVYLKYQGIISMPFYENSGGALATYWLRPMLEKIYGFNMVYFSKEEVVFGIPGRTRYSDYDIANGKRLDETYVVGDTIVEVFNKGEDKTNSYELSVRLTDDDFNKLAHSINQKCEHYEVETPYGADYIQNLFIYYDINMQRMLGLR